MANKYLRSTDGNDADDGSTWALANATMVGLAADMAAGDDAYISQAHAETDSTSTAMTIAFPGTLGSPNRIVGASDAAEPPTTLNGAGSLTRTGTSSTATLSFAGCFELTGGVYSVATSGAGAIRFAASDDDVQTYNGCTFKLSNNNSVPRILYGASASGAKNLVIQNNCQFEFANASQGFNLQKGLYVWNGGELTAGSAGITRLFATALANGQTNAVVKNFDLSKASSAFDMCAINFSCAGEIVLNRCKLPASWSGGLFDGLPLNPFFHVSMYNCDSGDTNYKILVGDLQGTLRDETTLVMTGGATDETTPIAWKITTNAGANETLTPFYTDWMAKRNASVGSAVTITVEILHDSTTDLTDGDIWLEVECLGTSGVPLGTFTSGKRGVLATAADHTNSSVTWTTTGLTNPNKQYLTVSVTPQEVGNIMVRVMVAKASYTVYINPEFSIT